MIPKQIKCYIRIEKRIQFASFRWTTVKSQSLCAVCNTATHKMSSVLLFFVSWTFAVFSFFFVFSTFTDPVSKGCGFTTSRGSYVAFRKVIQGLLLEEQLKNFLKVKHHTCVTFVIQCTITVTINIRVYHINILFK